AYGASIPFVFQLIGQFHGVNGPYQLFRLFFIDFDYQHRSRRNSILPFLRTVFLHVPAPDDERPSDGGRQEFYPEIVAEVQLLCLSVVTRRTCALFPDGGGEQDDAGPFPLPDLLNQYLFFLFGIQKMIPPEGGEMPGSSFAAQQHIADIVEGGGLIAE